MAVRVKGWKGVAFVILGPEMVEVEDELGYPELAPNEDRVRVRMVGDDQVHVVDKDDCTELAPEEYCSECGQIGCGWSHG